MTRKLIAKKMPTATPATAPSLRFIIDLDDDAALAVSVGDESVDVTVHVTTATLPGVVELDGSLVGIVGGGSGPVTCWRSCSRQRISKAGADRTMLPYFETAYF